MPSVMEAPIQFKRTAGNVGEIADLREKALGAFLEKLQLQEGECKVHIAPFINSLKEYQESRAIGVPVFYNIDEEGVVLYDIER